MNATYYVTLPAILILSVILLYRQRRRSSTNHCPCSYPVIGNLLAFIANRHRFFDWATELLAAAPTSTIEVRGPLNFSRGVCTADPAAVDHLLRSNFFNYVKGHRFSSHLSDLLGAGIFNVDDSLWSRQRKLASHAFTSRSLRSFAASAVRTETIRRLLPRLSAAASNGEVIDLQDVLRRFAFDNICAVAFGTDPGALEKEHADADHFFAAFDEAAEISAGRFFSPFPLIWKLKKLFNVGTERRLKHAVKVVDEYAMKVVESKEKLQRNENFDAGDLLSRFMAAMNENHYSNTKKKRFLRDIVVSFVLAGKDSTSSALTWFFWLVYKNPESEKKIVEEISLELAGEDEYWASYEELKGLHYLHAAITEAMRLYPPVPINSRVAVADDVLPDGTRVSMGWFADYSAYAMARMEKLWGPDCREFSPERWLNEDGEFVGVEPAKYPVFHAGPRTCLGKEMAYLQMKAVAASVLRDFKVVPVGGFAAGDAAAPAYELSLTLRMKGGFPVRIERKM